MRWVMSLTDAVDEAAWYEAYFFSFLSQRVWFAMVRYASRARTTMRHRRPRPRLRRPLVTLRCSCFVCQAILLESSVWMYM